MKGAPGRGTLEKEKPPILGMIQRGGQVVLKTLANVQQTKIKPIMDAGVAKGALIHTDEYDIYVWLPSWGYEHKTVCHGRGEYARDEDGDGGFGRCCVHGCDHIAASPKKSCRSTSPSSSSCTTPENMEKRC
ncbi:MAG: transposase [Methylocystis sp.]